MDDKNLHRYYLLASNINEILFDFFAPDGDSAWKKAGEYIKPFSGMKLLVEVSLPDAAEPPAGYDFGRCFKWY